MGTDEPSFPQVSGTIVPLTRTNTSARRRLLIRGSGVRVPPGAPRVCPGESPIFDLLQVPQVGARPAPTSTQRVRIQGLNTPCELGHAFHIGFVRYATILGRGFSSCRR